MRHSNIGPSSCLPVRFFFHLNPNAAYHACDPWRRLLFGSPAHAWTRLVRCLPSRATILATLIPNLHDPTVISFTSLSDCLLPFTDHVDFLLPPLSNYLFSSIDHGTTVLDLAHRALSCPPTRRLSRSPIDLAPPSHGKSSTARMTASPSRGCPTMA